MVSDLGSAIRQAIGAYNSRGSDEISIKIKPAGGQPKPGDRQVNMDRAQPPQHQGQPRDDGMMQMPMAPPPRGATDVGAMASAPGPPPPEMMMQGIPGAETMDPTVLNAVRALAMLRLRMQQGR